MIKKLNNKYFKKHPIKDISAAKITYNMTAVYDIDDLVNKTLDEGYKPKEEELQLRDEILKEHDSEKLLKYMRKNLTLISRIELYYRILEHEEEMMPLIKKRAMTSMQDEFIENVIYFFIHCQEDCCDWILQQYNNIRSEYLKSQLCLVLGHRGDISMIEFLMGEVKRFENLHLDEDFEQGPILALQLIKDNYIYNKYEKLF